MEKRIKIEVCVDSVESALAAQTGGADRVELCDNLMEGGTTPSAGSIEIARSLLEIKLHVIIRPRGGDFLYSDVEFAIMERDIRIAKDLGADGVVIGILDADGRIDRPRTARLIGLARPMSVTFHRAFDVARDPYEALEDIIKLGVDRILTSGQESTAAEGADLICELVKRAGDRIKIVGCGNLNERNIERFVAATGVSEAHFTALQTVASKMRFRNERVFMGGTLRPPEYSRGVTGSDIVRDIIRSIESD
ncbi:MAG: copper homeostasis protein CutC [Acidobacteria bacterium]|nr:copper homeostasis protein CutC [Acidobacteriota bacterium]